MKKLLVLSMLVACSAQAKVYTCDSYTIYQGNGSGSYTELSNVVDSDNRFTITTSETVINVKVNDTDMLETEFWKDYNVFRNNDGTIEETGSDFTMKTAIPQNNVFIPVKIVYHCK